MFRNYIPYPVFKRLFGDRRQFGLITNENDHDWIIFHDNENLWDFYENTQQKGFADKVCSMEYPVICRIDFSGKMVLEIGPGIIRHLQYIKDKPVRYTICDVNKDAFFIAERQLSEADISHETILLDRKKGAQLPFGDETFDIIISFNSLEHLFPLDSYLTEFKRILKPAGQLAGGIPCEGGLAWGLGRFLTTRRYVHKNYGINYDKIICWEHPNFGDFVIERLDMHFERQYLKLHPFSWLSFDFNVMASFAYEKEAKPRG